MAIRVHINLATEPFRRDRPVIVGTIALSVALIGALVLQAFLIYSERNQAADTRVLLDRLNRQLTRVKAEQNKFDVTLNQPANAEVLEKSLFLNLLIQHKAISWTKLFADLEKVMPGDVRLVNVRLPQVNARGHVLLDMQVAAKDAAPVVEFIRRLETSPQFSNTEPLTSLPPSQTEPFVRYRVSVSYAQKL